MARQKTGGKRNKANRDGIAKPVKLPSGAWRYRVRDVMVGKYVSGTFSEDPEIDKNRRQPGCKAGDDWAKKKQARISTGLDTGATNVSLAQLGADYIAKRKDMDRCKGHIQAIEHTLSVAAEAKVTDLTDKGIVTRMQRHLSSLVARRPGQVTTPKVSARVKNHHINILRSIGDYGVQRQILIRNPFDLLERFDEAKRHRKVFTISELRRLVSDNARFPWRLQAETQELLAKNNDDLKTVSESSGLPIEAIQHRLDAKEGEEDQWWLFIVLVAYTGLRSETVRNLTWDMVDWEARRLRVPAEIVKTNSDIRAPIQPELGEILREIQGQAKRKTILPATIVEMNSDRANELTQKFLMRNGVIPNGRSVHAFRHTVASLLTATGMTTFLVMDSVGHSSTETSKHYSHGADEFREQVVKEGWKEGEFFLRREPPKSGSHSHRSIPVGCLK